MATRGGGPLYQLFGRKPLYRWGDALDWAKGRLSKPIRSTSELEAVQLSANRRPKVADDLDEFISPENAKLFEKQKRPRRMGGKPLNGNGEHAASAEPCEQRAKLPRKYKFPMTLFDDIKFDPLEEWLVKMLLPRQGVAAFYGASQSLKTFAALDLSLHVSLGWPWAGRRVQQTPTVYIAAEGARGLKKRIAGWRLQHGDHLPDKIPFGLIEVAPNLGTGEADLKELIASIEVTGVRPGLITIDTLAQSLGTGDENGAGMVQFVANATALANHFGCLVLIISPCWTRR